MDIKHFQALVAIADAGSITRAAAQVHITQPTLSTRIATLEDELGSKLFVRSKQGVVMTDAGEKMYAYAKNILKLAHSAVRELSTDLENPQGAIVIGCQESLCSTLGAQVIRGALEKYPQINLRFHSENTPELYKQLGVSRFDMGILQKDVRVIMDGEVQHCESLFESTTLECFHLFDDEILFCTQRKEGAPVFPQESISVSALASKKVALPPASHPVTHSLEWIAGQSDIELTRFVYCNSQEVVFDLIDSGLCSALLTKQVVEDKTRDHNVSAYRIENYRIMRSVTLCCSPNWHMHTVPRLIKDLVVELVQGAL